LLPFLEALQTGDTRLAGYLYRKLSVSTQVLLNAWTWDQAPSDTLLDGVRLDVNQCLRAGIYERTRFDGIRISTGTQRLLAVQPRSGVDVIDLSRSLLEDAFPEGIARRPNFPDLHRHYAAKMAELVGAKASVAMLSHRRIGWLARAFKQGPEAVMQALLDRGFIDVTRPSASRLFDKTQFEGPMFRVFSDGEKAAIIAWIESLATMVPNPVRPEPDALPGDAEKAADQAPPTARDGLDGGDLTTPQSVRPDWSFGRQRRRTGMGSVH
jgi:hypothetical protein